VGTIDATLPSIHRLINGFVSPRAIKPVARLLLSPEWPLVFTADKVRRRICGSNSVPNYDTSKHRLSRIRQPAVLNLYPQINPLSFHDCDTQPKNHTYKNGSNFLPHQTSRRGNIIIGQEVNQMLDILHSQCESYADAEGTVVVDVEDGQLFSNDARALGKCLCFCSSGHGQRRR